MIDQCSKNRRELCLFLKPVLFVLVLRLLAQIRYFQETIQMTSFITVSHTVWRLYIRFNETPLHTADAPEIWMQQLEFDRREKLKLSWIQCKLTRKASKLGNSLETASNIQEKTLTIPKPTPDCEKRKLWNILSLQAPNSAPTSGNSLIVRRVSSGRKKSCVIWTKYAIPRQIKPEFSS